MVSTGPQSYGNFSLHGSHAIVGSTVAINSSQTPEARCLEALFAFDQKDDRTELLHLKGGRTDGTCEWILSKEAWKDWLSGRSSFLWIRGLPGKGKTMMSAFITEHLESRGEPLAYLFCRNTVPQRSNAASIMQSLLWQIIEAYPRVIDQLLPHFTNGKRSKSTVSNAETMWRLLCAVCNDERLGKIAIVLDGVDECDDATQRWLIARFRELTSFKLASGEMDNNARVLICSRDIHYLYDIADQQLIGLDAQNDEFIHADIAKFVMEKVPIIASQTRLTEDIRHHVEKTLLTKAEGTFLWVGLAVLELNAKRTAIEIVQTLEQLPPGLDALYNRMLDRIPIGMQSLALEVLRWIMLAQAPMSSSELAAAVNPKDELLKPVQIIENVVELCKPLIVTRERVTRLNRCRLPPSQMPEGSRYKIETMIEVMHSTAKEYLLRDATSAEPTLQRYFLKFDEDNFRLAWRCLDYLADILTTYTPAIKTPYPLDIYTDDPKLADATFLSHAARLWVEYARNASNLADGLLTHPSHFFGQSGKDFRGRWVRLVMDLDENKGIEKIIPLQRLTRNNRRSSFSDYGGHVFHFLCYWGFNTMAQSAISQTQEWRHQRDFDGASALIMAVDGLDDTIRSTNIDIVILLLENGIDVNLKDNRGDTALQAAVITRNPKTVEVLLRYKASVELPNNQGSTALHKAVIGQLTGIVKQLLDAGAPCNVLYEGPEGSKSTALACAIAIPDKDDRLEITRLLLESGADPNFSPEALETAFRQNRHEDILSILEGHGATTSSMERLRAILKKSGPTQATYTRKTAQKWTTATATSPTKAEWLAMQNQRAAVHPHDGAKRFVVSWKR